MSNAPKKPQGGMPMGGPHGPRGMGPRQPINKKVLLRVLSYLKPYWPRLLVVFFCIVLDAIATASAATFLGTLIDDYIVPLLADAASGIAPVYTGLLTAILKMAGLYLLAVVAVFLQSRIMAIISHSILKNVRNEMFAHMQLLPIRYFDTHTHGEVMSFYTNDIDTLRQLISQTLPNVFSSAISLLVVFISMLNCSVWLTLVVVLCTLAMLKVTGKLGAKSGTFFVKQQTSLASLNGYIEEMINGQKVVKVFNHEEIAKGEFDHRNDDLCENATSANRFANVMGPVSNNMGHIQYVILAIIGGAMAIVGITNLSLTGGFGTLTLGAITAFLTLSRNFMRPISQVMQQVNFIAMAMAGAERIFSLLDETPEADEGYVTLVNAREENGKLVESDKRTGIWAWKHPHQDGSVTYTRLTGNVEMTDVDFAYEEGKPVLHDITLYAKPGQKVAFVGATGAGKTTITNLINRFYDIADGKVRYDGININKIRKSDLRRSLGVVLRRKIASLSKEATLTCDYGDCSDLINGLDRRIWGKDNGYFGKTNKAVTYTFSEPKHVAGFRLVVDSDLNREFVEGNPDGLNTTSVMFYPYSHNQTTFGFPKCMIKHYKIEAQGEDSQWRVVYEDKENHQRFIKQPLDITARAVRFIPLSTYFSETKVEDYGSSVAHIFNFEVF